MLFQKLDLAIIKMGEQTGVLPKCMNELADFLEWKEDIRSNHKRAAIYPSFVIAVLAAVIGVWVGYVLPQMAMMLKEMGTGLPGITQNHFQHKPFPSVKLVMDSRWDLFLWNPFLFVTENKKRRHNISQISVETAGYRQRRHQISLWPG